MTLRLAYFRSPYKRPAKMFFERMEFIEGIVKEGMVDVVLEKHSKTYITASLQSNYRKQKIDFISIAGVLGEQYRPHIVNVKSSSAHSAVLKPKDIDEYNRVIYIISMAVKFYLPELSNNDITIVGNVYNSNLIDYK